MFAKLVKGGGEAAKCGIFPAFSWLFPAILQLSVKKSGWNTDDGWDFARKMLATPLPALDS